jgi:hypothetical protein
MVTAGVQVTGGQGGYLPGGFIAAWMSVELSALATGLGFLIRHLAANLHSQHGGIHA